MNIIAKINLIQDLLKTHQLDGFLIPSNDEFQNEYVPNHLNRLKYLTGFILMVDIYCRRNKN